MTKPGKRRTHRRFRSRIHALISEREKNVHEPRRTLREGKQVSDLVAFNARDVGEFLSNGRPLDYLRKIYPMAEDHLTIEAKMDPIIGLAACSAEQSIYYAFKPIDYEVMAPGG